MTREDQDLEGLNPFPEDSYPHLTTFQLRILSIPGIPLLSHPSKELSEDFQGSTRLPGKARWTLLAGEAGVRRSWPKIRQLTQQDSQPGAQPNYSDTLFFQTQFLSSTLPYSNLISNLGLKTLSRIQNAEQIGVCSL